MNQSKGSHRVSEAIIYFLSFKSYVVLPIIIFGLAMVFRIKLSIAIKSALSIGIGFVGIFMSFDFFIKIIKPVVAAIIGRTGLHMNVLDAGWPPLAAITWAFPLAPLLLVIFLLLNIVLLVTRLTKTVNIDIWNYWHVILLAAMIEFATGNVWLAVGLSSLVFVMVLKQAEWSAPLINRFSGMKGICIPHLSGISYFPLAMGANWLLDRIPGINRLNARPEDIQRRIGIFGEPMILGLLIGSGLGIAAGWDFKAVAELAVCFAAVIVILPVMCGILGNSLVPISEGMKLFIQRRFPKMGETFIGLDVAVLFGIPSVMVTSLLLIPVALAAAFLLPGISFIPLGELTNIVVPIAFVAAATRGNVVRAFIVGVPIIIGNLYVASAMAGFITGLAGKAHFQLEGFSGVFTSFLDGGNLFRAWMVQVSLANPLALALLPLGIALLWLTRALCKRRNAEADAAQKTTS